MKVKGCQTYSLVQEMFFTAFCFDGPEDPAEPFVDSDQIFGRYVHIQGFSSLSAVNEYFPLKSLAFIVCNKIWNRSPKLCTTSGQKPDRVPLKLHLHRH